MNYFTEIKKSIIKNKPYYIDFYGDSTTSMEFVFPNWPEILRYVLKDYAETKVGDYQKAHWNIITTNFGMNGASSEDLSKRFHLAIIRNKPDLLIFSGSENDYYYGIDKESTEKNAVSVIRQALKNNIRVIFMTTVPSPLPELNRRVVEYIETYRNVAKFFFKHKRFIFIDLFKCFPKKDLKKYFSLISEMGNEVVGYKPGQVDPVHFNRYGNAVVSGIILKKAFGINFNADKFIKDISDNSKKYPEY